LVEILAAIIKNTHRGGVIVFFSSFAAMNEFVRYARSDPQQLWQRKLRSPIVEQKRMVKDTLSKFDHALQKAQASHISGAVPLFAVCRGQLSEGIDLADDRCRTVVVVGLPLSPLQDPIVQLKRTVKGDSWYLADAMTAVNQALGRCVRHANDFGALFLLDSRFSYHLPKLSNWLRDQVQISNSIDDLIQNLPAFFHANYRDVPPRVVQKANSVSTSSMSSNQLPRKTSNTPKIVKQPPPRRPPDSVRPTTSQRTSTRSVSSKRPLEESNSLLQADFRNVSWPSMRRISSSKTPISEASIPLKKEKKSAIELAFSDSSSDEHDSDDDDSIDIAPPKPDAAALGGSLRAQRILNNSLKKQKK